MSDRNAAKITFTVAVIAGAFAFVYLIRRTIFIFVLGAFFAYMAPLLGSVQQVGPAEFNGKTRLKLKRAPTQHTRLHCDGAARARQRARQARVVQEIKAMHAGTVMHVSC